MPYQTPSQHMAFQGMPKLDAPFVDKNGLITFGWYRLLTTLWNLCGAQYAQFDTGQILQAELDSNGLPTGNILVINSRTGAVIGELVMSGTAQEDQIILKALELAPPIPPQQQDPLQTIFALMPSDQIDFGQAALLAQMTEVPL